MLPSVLASEVQEGLESFLKAQFPVTTPAFSEAFHQFVERDAQGQSQFIKGPYVSLKMPFRPGTVGRTWFEGVLPGYFKPYIHQERAWERIGGQDPQSTLVATGTGSGKTECFLWPILNYCYEHRAQEGVKAILIYPMNALATDQAKRFAKEVLDSQLLKDSIRVGMYVGGDDGQSSKMMEKKLIKTASGEEKYEYRLITDREEMRKNPPDILLTNYKMLDYLLIRPEDKELWKHNSPETLKYMVVDEIHSFDGAQGTDLACLIRRLKYRLKMEAGHLCCVGTSATLGGGGGVSSLADFGQTVFGEDLNDDSVITEDLLSFEEFVDGAVEISIFPTPSEKQLEDLNFKNYASDDDYLQHQIKIWLGIQSKNLYDEKFRISLGNHLKAHPFFRRLIQILEHDTLSYPAILIELNKMVPEIQDSSNTLYKQFLLDSIFSLISLARRDENGRVLPFMSLRVQLWLRELRRVVASVSATPQITFFDDLKTEEQKNHLPLIHCMNCGHMSWTSYSMDNPPGFGSGVETVYQAFFNKSNRLKFINLPNGEASDDFFENTGDTSISQEDLSFSDGDDALKVNVFHPKIKSSNGKERVEHICSKCESHNSLLIVGSRAASLTSSLLSSVMASKFSREIEDDHGAKKKVLTFSDSVQDASHRSAFFQARTTRTTILQGIYQAYQSKPNLRLSELGSIFIDYWRNKIGLAQSIANFLPADLHWLNEWEVLKKTGQVDPDSSLVDYYKKRLNWEMISEFGYFSRLGRSLEKSRVLSTSLDLGQFDLKKAIDGLSQHIGGVNHITQSSLEMFIREFITHLQSRGGISHEIIADYITDGGNPYLFGNRKPFMKNIGRGSRNPIFLQASGKNSNFEILIPESKKRSWYQQRLIDCFKDEVNGIESICNILLESIVSTLAKSQILVQYDSKDQVYYGINPEKLIIQETILQHQCNSCGDIQQTSYSLEDRYCFQKKCLGSYSSSQVEKHFFGELYKQGDLVRLFSGEHTGLLARDTREALEHRFIHRSNPADENLLSCTPTLEMGIDLSDLSTVVLCSVPPAQASFLQRIGRAGRDTGNAFVSTLANGRPHDLYFYEDPMEMISGHVDTPACYMQAPEILKRQLIAFCMDQWIQSGDRIGSIPNKLSDLFINWKKKKEEGTQFPFDFLKELSLNRRSWFDGFSHAFEPTVGKEVIESLEDFYYGDDHEAQSLEFRILNGLNELFEERESRKKQIKKISNQIIEIESKPIGETEEETLKSLNSDKSLLIGINSTINQKQVLNYFTDEGLLPNYAFPEQGITLKSVIVDKVDNEWKERSFEYVRPAGSAIREFSPSNVFYAESRSVKINQVDISSSPIEKWRVCDECSNMELVEDSAAVVHNCPQCGSDQWGDSGQVVEMLRLKQVYARTSSKKSITLDDSDSRQTSFFSMGMFVQASNRDVRKAWAIDPKHQTSFGFEYLNKVELREVNFGEPSDQADTLFASSREYNCDGFILCNECGKVAEKRRDKSGDYYSIEHTHYCKQYSKEPEKVRETNFDQNSKQKAVFLYRDFISEAIRIHIPVYVIEKKEAFQSLSAALYLGLKKHFGGNPGHLRITDMEEPDVDSPDVTHNYLVLFDGVPGGTGVLKQLMSSPKELMSVFEKSLHALKTCSCNNDPDKDGCYQCVYGFRERHDSENTSRQRAVELLELILKHQKDLIEVENLRSGIPGSIGSELEKIFIELLSHSSEDLNTSIKATTLDNDVAWQYIIAENHWTIKPQEKIVYDQNGNYTIADYVFIPKAPNRAQKKIAIYLDGYKWHGGKEDEPEKAGHDIRKRQGVLDTNQYWVFTLSWDDVLEAFELTSRKKNEVDFTYGHTKVNDWLESNLNPSIQFQKKASQSNPTVFAQFSEILQINSWTFLTRFLSAPPLMKAGEISKSSEAIWSKFITEFLKNSTSQTEVDSEEYKTQYEHFYSGNDSFSSKLESLGCLDPFAEIFHSIYHDQELPIYGLLMSHKVHAKSLDISFRFHDVDLTKGLKDYKSWWNEFFRLMNVLQFTHNQELSSTVNFFSSLVIPENEWNSEEAMAIQSTNDDTQTVYPDEWQEVFEALSEEGFSEILSEMKRLIDQGLPIPEIGEEDLEGKVDVALLSWNDLKVALLYPDESGKVWTEQGWKFESLDDLKVEPSRLTQLFEGKL